MKKTIFNVYVAMQDQEQCDRMKKLCVDNELQYWHNPVAFNYESSTNAFSNYDEEFFVFVGERYELKDKTQVTEQEFIELLNEYKNENK